LMESIGSRIYFAGEAAHETLWGTVGGAWDSGERAADAILRRFAPAPPARSKKGRARQGGIGRTRRGLRAHVAAVAKSARDLRLRLNERSISENAAWRSGDPATHPKRCAVLAMPSACRWIYSPGGFRCPSNPAVRRRFAC